MNVGWRSRPSLTRPSRLFSKISLRLSPSRKLAWQLWSSNCVRSCRTGRWRPWWRPTMRSGVCLSLSPSPLLRRLAMYVGLRRRSNWWPFLARAFAVNPSRQEARPWRALEIDRSARPSRSALPDDECEPLAQGTILNERRVRHINNNTACTAPAVRSRWGNPSNRKVADIYISTPALRHWEAPRRTTVDARNQPADKRMINRRLKPHRRPCAHFWSGSKPYGSPPGERGVCCPSH